MQLMAHLYIKGNANIHSGYDSIAQSEEQLPFKQWVAVSSTATVTTTIRYWIVIVNFLF